MHLLRLMALLAVLSAFSLIVYEVIQQKERFIQILSNVTIQDYNLLNNTHTAWVREYYTKQAADRIILLNNLGVSDMFGEFYNVIVPEARCPDLVRLGRTNDGGKYVCNPKAFPKKNCSIYSFGLDNEVSFDVEIQQITGCQLYGYDSAEQNETTKMKYNSIRGKLGVATISPASYFMIGNSTTIEQLFHHNGDESAELVKMDIEGSEHFVLVPFLSKYKVCQLLLEIHGQPIEHLRLLNSIAKLDYVLFSYEVNGWAMEACEYSFIHMDCMKRHGVVELKRYLHEVVNH